ncbi:MAG TPA: single-stranded DNA-binding protein [Thermotogota bacterium]|nr:single-stranded DNA-binding protein [Thermotogota bacterium]HRW92054.1 single-stranded DNA-binding protein [Thermotogota bacterium]
MSISYNRVVLVGRLTRNPEEKYSTSGTHIATFRLAVDRPVFSSQKGSEPVTDFIPITTFGKTADFVKSYLSQGRLVLVEGRLQISRFKTQDGTDKFFTDVVADQVRFMETKASAQTASHSYPEETSQEPYSKESFDTPGKNEENAYEDNQVDVMDGPMTSDDDEVPF